MGRKSNKQKEAERAFLEAKNAQPLDTETALTEIRTDTRDAARVNFETARALAREAGAAVMRLAIVELVERRGLPELALEIALMKVKL